MLKKSLILLAFTSFMNYSAIAGKGDPKELSGEDRQVSRKSHFVLTQVDDNLRVIVDLRRDLSNADYTMNVVIYESSKLKFIITELVLTKEAQKKMGLFKNKKKTKKTKVDSLKRKSKSEEKKISTSHVRNALLTTSLCDLLTLHSVDTLYSKVLSDINVERFSDRKITMQEVYERLPRTSSLSAFFTNPMILFTEKDPNLRIIPLFKSGFSTIEAHFQRTPADTFNLGLQVKLKEGEYVSFSLSPSNCLLQDEDIADRLIRIKTLGIEINDKFMAAFRGKKMSELLGLQGFKQFMHTLASKGFKSKDSSELDYSDFTPDFTIEQFCQLLDARLSVAKLVTWATQK